MPREYPGVDAAITGGGLRQDIFRALTAKVRPSRGAWGEVFAVLPFASRTVIMTLTYANLKKPELENGFKPWPRRRHPPWHGPDAADLRHQGPPIAQDVPVVDSVVRVESDGKEKSLGIADRSGYPQPCSPAVMDLRCSHENEYIPARPSCPAGRHDRLHRRPIRRSRQLVVGGRAGASCRRPWDEFVMS